MEPVRAEGRPRGGGGKREGRQLQAAAKWAPRQGSAAGSRRSWAVLGQPGAGRGGAVRDVLHRHSGIARPGGAPAAPAPGLGPGLAAHSPGPRRGGLKLRIPIGRNFGPRISENFGKIRIFFYTFFLRISATRESRVLSPAESRLSPPPGPPGRAPAARRPPPGLRRLRLRPGPREEIPGMVTKWYKMDPWLSWLQHDVTRRQT